jgi:hypothetical protein
MYIDNKFNWNLRMIGYVDYIIYIMICLLESTIEDRHYK